MNVLFYRRANHEEVRGGDLVQLHATAAALQRQKVRITFSSDPKLDLTAFDLVHAFNSPRFDETLSFMRNAKAQGKPVAFSTIFWSKEELAVGIASSPKVRLARTVLGIPLTLWLWRVIKHHQGRRDPNSNYSLERQLFQTADILLPNSEGEMREIASTYGTKRPSYQVVRNAIEGTTYPKEPTLERQPYVLSVGRIENRKNTLKLIEACHRLKLPLTLIGGAADDDPYAQDCLARTKRYGFTHIAHIEPAQLIPYYYQAAVHAMVSWYETPGLSSMEAACGGCTIVSTDRGSTKEYFDDLVHYCNPFSQTSIEQALAAAMRSRPNLKLRARILDKYTWDKAADDTLAGYEKTVS
jgi:glycosyltransferase involved in cell wall biosynthesis